MSEKNKKMSAGSIIDLLKATFADWSEDKASRLAAALSYYTIFSLPPLLIILIGIAGLVYGEEAVQGRLVDQIAGLVGEQGANAIQTIIAGASDTRAGIVATIIGIATLLLGAAGFFGALQDSLNTIWEVQPKPKGILGTIKDRFFSFTLILGTGFLLLVSLVISATLTAVQTYLGNLLPGVLAPLLQIVNFVVSFGVVTLLFALIYKIVPDAEVEWRDVWAGAIVTALLFTIGKFVLGWYLGRSSVTSTYGAAGSLILILLWVYYSAQILFFGAEFTQVYARRYGKEIQPAANAVRLTEEQRAKQGIPHRRKEAGPEGERRAPRGTVPVADYIALADRRANRNKAIVYVLSIIGFIVGTLGGAFQIRRNLK